MKYEKKSSIPNHTFYFYFLEASITWLVYMVVDNFHFSSLNQDIPREIQFQCCNETSKIFVLRRFLAEDPSSSSSLVHFKLSKNLPKILKIFGIKSLFVEEILKEN